MARPKKVKTEETPVPAATPEVGEETTSTIAAAVEKVKDAVALDPAMKDQLLNLVKGVGIAAADAALVYVDTNIKNIDLGRYSSTVQALATIGVRELRNLLHGGQVSDSVHLEALEVVFPEMKEEDEKKEE